MLHVTQHAVRLLQDGTAYNPNPKLCSKVVLVPRVVVANQVCYSDPAICPGGQQRHEPHEAFRNQPSVFNIPFKNVAYKVEMRRSGFERAQAGHKGRFNSALLSPGPKPKVHVTNKQDHGSEDGPAGATLP